MEMLLFFCLCRQFKAVSEKNLPISWLSFTEEKWRILHVFLKNVYCLTGIFSISEDSRIFGEGRICCIFVVLHLLRFIRMLHDLAGV
jgi:hypothetical protein